MTSFPVSDVDVSGDRLAPAQLVSSLAARLAGKLESADANCGNLVECSGHPFVHAVHLAFARHLPLVLSPDDVWLCLAQGFGAHVNLHAESLRRKLVSHEGRLEIEVRRDDFVKGSAINDWGPAIAQFSQAIEGRLGAARDLVVADFSTTGPAELAASQIVLMESVRAYFDFVLKTLCGIPRIALLGEVDDWRAIRRRAERFSEFGLAGWTCSLLPVLDQFVAARSGSVDGTFWRSFYKRNDASGGPYVTGWINVLFPYIQSPGALSSTSFRSPGEVRANPHAEQWEDPSVFDGGPTTDAFALGLSRVQFIWNYFGRRHPMELVGGFVGVSQDPESLAVRPAIGWGVGGAEPA